MFLVHRYTWCTSFHLVWVRNKVWSIISDELLCMLVPGHKQNTNKILKNPTIHKKDSSQRFV